jgi:hypothetical protein
VVVEIDLGAERVVDARSARRLVPLELSDVAVPSNARGGAALFFRVLGRADGTLHIELWQRGEYYGERVLRGTGENPQLVARRVALAAAELARRLVRKRQLSLARDARLRQARLERERMAAARTQDGPLALRSELSFASAAGRLQLFGSRLGAELTLAAPLRVDWGAELWAGQLAGDGALLEGLSVSPAYRWALGRALDVDVGVGAALLLVQLPSASSVDGVTDQLSAWTARLDGKVRLQLRLGRQLRGLLGAEGGGLLRDVTWTKAGSGPDRLRGLWLGVSLGLVLTPLGAR